MTAIIMGDESLLTVKRKPGALSRRVTPTKIFAGNLEALASGTLRFQAEKGWSIAHPLPT